MSLLLQNAKEAFQAYKDNYVEQADKLMSMVDVSVPRLLFFKKAGERNIM